MKTNRIKRFLPLGNTQFLAYAPILTHIYANYRLGQSIVQSQKLSQTIKVPWDNTTKEPFSNEEASNGNTNLTITEMEKARMKKVTEPRINIQPENHGKSEIDPSIADILVSTFRSPTKSQDEKKPSKIALRIYKAYQKARLRRQQLLEHLVTSE